MKASFLIAVLCCAPVLEACNSTRASKLSESCDATCHAGHTPEQHAAFLKRVKQLETEESADPSGLGGGGGGGHHH